MRRLATGAELLSMGGFKDKTELDAIVAELNARADVEYAEPDRIMKPLATPSDPRYSEQWHYYETTGGLNLPSAWDTTTGSGAVVGVIDTGYLPHADLLANLLDDFGFFLTTFTLERSIFDPVDVTMMSHVIQYLLVLCHGPPLDRPT